MIIWKILAGASWITFVIGLVWTGKVSFESRGAGPPFETRTLELENAATIELESASDGDAAFSLVVESPDQYDTEEFVAWLDRRDLPLRCEVEVRGGAAPISWIIDGDDLKFLDSIVIDDDRALLVLAKRAIPAADGARYSISARVTTEDSFFLDHRPAVLTGRMDEAPINLPVRDKRPGLVLLAGAAGAFIHLFGIWIRLVVPWREALPPEGEEIPATA